MLATLMAEKGGQTNRGRGDRNRLPARGCRGREIPGEQAKGDNTESAGWEVDAGPGGQAIQDQKRSYRIGY